PLANCLRVAVVATWPMKANRAAPYYEVSAGHRRSGCVSAAARTRLGPFPSVRGVCIGGHIRASESRRKPQKQRQLAAPLVVEASPGSGSLLSVATVSEVTAAAPPGACAWGQRRD